MSSMVSQMALGRCSAEVKARILAAKSIADVEAIITDFVQ